ncbi:RagB/SusD family nutrient uptake outer membrane protein [Aestuariibaculum lutulentum]|uniref:RagB/SusD family nutrient uptake outer membrane protein n=2 Tax=Aestuariibaculum lutulentum TaxID=2920935 RepID=A0ABS9RFE9_9FLAO|nr:RagB/SusD family nutrient uptake outer membrane protein [Aestuariibaculum lutulentum]MCH4551665.1 RagB/SusD family nutrient uptake outer membrane protein [Aestuariibaculum lutulentum]
MRINTYIAWALLLIVSVSCSDDFLEEKGVYGKYDDSFYESEERVDWYINNVYYDFFGSYTNPLSTVVGAYSQTNSRLTEEIGGMQDLINSTITLTTANEGSGYYGTKLEAKVKNEPYHRIRDINAFLEEVDVKGASLDEDYRATAKGQMYYLRAIQYFELMRVYGGVPIVTSVQAASSTDESIKLPRASVSQMVDQIIEDLDMAASLLPGNWPPSDYGRFTRGAALAQKARVLLTYASPLFNTSWDSNNERWQAALQAGLAAEVQLTEDGYGLYGNSAKDWQDMFLIDNSFCSEAITVQLLGSGNSSNIMNNTWENSVRLASQLGSGGLAAPKEMIDLFPMADGSKPTTANGYDEFLFFVNRDPRFYRTFSFSGNKWGYKDNEDNAVWAYRWLGLDDNGVQRAYFSDNNQVSSPAFVRKMSDIEESEDNFQNSGTDIFEYRYAELLLNIAEAYAGVGDLPNCVAYLGKVRNRVGIPSTNNYGIGTLADKFEAFKACLYERQVELAYEGKRFWDVQRWMLYNDDASVNNTTCATLGLDRINGTKRTGNYLQFKGGVVTSEDPLASVRQGVVVDPDASDFDTQIQTLAGIYTDNFMLADLETPLDNINNVEAKIDWKQNYYIMGLKSDVLSLNPWLEQTIGWKDTSDNFGTFNYQE